MRNFEQIVCNICESTDREKKLYSVRSGHLVHCRRCDLYYANPRRSDIIQNVLSDNTPSELYEGKKLNYWGRMVEFNGYLKEIHKFKQPPGRTLDIGCYEGYFLYEARKYGWKCYGVEPNVGGARYAREWLKLDVKQCILEKAGFDNSYFDVVTLFATLEHVSDPSAVVSGLRRIIKDDGLLVITVPTIPFYLGLIKSKWRMFIGGHYYFFTDSAMSKLLAKTGFNLISSRYVSKSVDLNTISSRLSDDWQPHNLGSVGKFLRKIIMEIGAGRIRLSVNLFDTKIYFARPF